VEQTPAKILLVDDESRNLDALESILQTPDYELVRATSADQALMLLLTGEFAVIVLDIQMPGMSGLELAALIKQRRRTQHIPIIFLTAYYQDDKDVIQGYGSGAVDYLTKPISPVIVRSKIAVFVDLFRKTRALEQEIAQRQSAEAALRESNRELEVRVQERTSELSSANDELRAREAALRKSEGQARASSRAKDDFLAALSHELRTPLNPVLLLASAAARDFALPAAVRADFETIQKNVELEARLIDDLLDLTRITRGKLPLDVREIELHAALENAIAVVQTEISEKEITLTRRLTTAHSTVWGDAVRLQQICWNLLKNAVKFTPRGGQITVETGTDAEGQIELAVVDTGIGLTAEELARIFEPFVQGEHASGSGSHRFGGLGLGLAISRMLVEMHSGHIRASSPGRGQGAEFTIVLPLAKGASELARSRPFLPLARSRSESDPAPRASARGQRIRVLLVDDHAPTRSTLVQLLGQRDYDVTAAGSAGEARARALGRDFDLLISDIGLPDGGGCDLLRELRTDHPALCGIALSGYGMDEDIARSREAGFSEHRIKPVSIDALDAAILNAMGAASSERGARR
jgi:signal transduction histidine kinase